LTLVNPA